MNQNVSKVDFLPGTAVFFDASGQRQCDFFTFVRVENAKTLACLPDESNCGGLQLTHAKFMPVHAAEPPEGKRRSQIRASGVGIHKWSEYKQKECS